MRDITLVEYESMEDHDGAVHLEPFAHQVGGHTCMLLYDESSVCKPLINREKHFYQIMPQELRAFTPQFRGLECFIFV
jgi:inositol-hexakisphosphate kinase